MPYIPTKLNKKSRRKYVRWGIVAGNLLLLFGIGGFLIVNNSASEAVRTGTINSAVATASSVSSPLDQLSSAQIALVAAEMTKIPELTAVRNQADSEGAMLAVSRSDSTVLSKPLIIETAQKSKKDIIQYVTKPGDTISSIAATFRVNANSIRWSNSLSGDSVAAGRTLYIPPGEGIVYQVKSGDTVDSVSARFQANKDLFINVNDAEGGQLTPGEYIWVPNGVQPLARASIGSRFSWGGGPLYGFNGYDRGYCTWWAATRRAQIGSPIPSNLGNAITWKVLAQRAGLAVGTKPAGGAVIWTPASSGYGHVGFVERVNGDGSVWVSDMNSRGYAAMDTSSGRAGGWNRVSYRLLSPEQAANFWYIY